jgi:hypothetical protein
MQIENVRGKKKRERARARQRASEIERERALPRCRGENNSFSCIITSISAPTSSS